MSYTRRMGVRSASKRVPRHLRNEDLRWDDFTHKTYQVELLDSALHNNTMVCMSSSSGRMFIAVMLIKEMASGVRKPLTVGGKRTFFLVQTDEDIPQLALALQHPIEMLATPLTETATRGWSSQQWHEELNRTQVIILTGTLLQKLLQENIVGLDSCNLLILDESHHVLKNHPYKFIMDTYGSMPAEQRPRILGLTTNIFAGQYQQPEALDSLISSLETALYSRAETSTLVIAERYGICPKEMVIECEDYIDTTGLCDEMYCLLEDAIDFLDACKMELTKELDNRDPCQIPRAALVECHNILRTLGPWCAACLADMLIVQLEKIEKQKEFIALHKRFLKLAATKLRMLSKMFDNHFKLCDYSVEELLTYSTPKVAKLMDSLHKYKPETDFVIISEDIGQMSENNSDSDMSDFESDFSDNDNDEEADKSLGGKQIHVAIKKVSPEAEGKPLDPLCLDEDKYLCGVVFVDNQHEAYALNKFIEEVCSWDENLCFVKSCHITAVKTVGSKEKKQYKKQEEILRKFRMQELNLLIATSVLEEGVDIPKCNCIIRFDIPHSYRSYSLSKGRARARDAEYIILVEGENVDEFHGQLKNYQTIEKVLIRRGKKSQPVQDTAEETNLDDNPVEPYVPSAEESHIRVTMDTAIMLINRYCAKLPSDAFTHLTPSCLVTKTEVEGQRRFTASLRLPINSPVKVQLQGPAMASKLRAKQAVALKMCEILHKQGELDDSLMPMGKEMLQGEDGESDEGWDDDEDIIVEARPGTTKRKQYYCKKVSSALVQSQPLADRPCNLYIVNMTLTGPITEEQNTRGRKIYAPEETHRSFGILTSKCIPLVPMFPVFTRSGEVTVAVDLLCQKSVSPDQLSVLKTFHKFLFSNVLRLEKDPMDFCPNDASMGYLVVPLTKDDSHSDIDIDWKFTEKVEASINQKQKEPPEKFVFVNEDYEDAVVMPSYRNIDQPQYFYVAEICTDLNPLSPFPSPELYKTFAAYYTQKYGLTITNMEQPLLDVDHTSARLNLLIPRYMNQKGVPLPTSSAETKKARRENLQQKQILVPELCDIHVFFASLWRKAVCLPAILYRMNYLLLAEEIRKHIAMETKIGVVNLEEGFRFPQLDFGFDTSPENLIRTVEVENDDETMNNDGKEDDSVTTSFHEEADAVVNGLSNNEDEGKTSELNGSASPAWDSSKVETIEERPKKDAKEETASTFQEIDKERESLGWKFSNTQCDVCAKMCQDLNMVELQLSSCPKCVELNSYNKGKDGVVGNNHCKDNNITSEDADTSTVDEVIAGMKDMTFTIDDNDKTEGTKNGINKEYTLKDARSLFEKIDKELADGEVTSKRIQVNSVGCQDSVEPINISNSADSRPEEQSNVQYKYLKNCDKLKETDHNGHCADVTTSSETSASKLDETEKLSEKIEVVESAKSVHFDPNEKGDATEQEETVQIKDTEDNCLDIFDNVGKFVDIDAEGHPEVESRKKYKSHIFLDENIELSTFVGPSPCVILQALTMSNANDFFSLERLETIGDSFLKYAITVYLYCSYPGIHEGKLSYLRSKQVSNYNLYRLGKRKSLAECMISTKFEPYENWLPPGYIVNEDKRKGPVPKVHVANQATNRVVSAIFSSNSSSSQVSSRKPTDAEVTEADISTSEMEHFHEDLEEIDMMCQEMREEESQKTGKADAGQNVTPYNLQLHHCLPDKSIADCVEALIGCYLTSCGKMAALRFMSWMGLKVLPKNVKINDGESSKCEDVLFEKLPMPQSPFLSQMTDAQHILDTLLSGYDSFEERIGYTFKDRSYLLQAFTHASYHYNTVTDCYQRLEFLGDAVLDYVITRHLYEDSDKYSPGVLTDLRSALVNNNIFAALAVKWDFHKYFKAISPALFHVIEKFVARQKEFEDEIDVEDEEDHDQEKEHVELEVPKALGDIFESVAGAVYLDSGMSLDVVWSVFYRIMGPQIDKYLKNIPKSPVRELLEQEPETAKFEKPERTMDGKIRVTVNVVGKGVFTGVGRNYRIAKSAAAKKALRCIKTFQAQGLID